MNVPPSRSSALSPPERARSTRAARSAASSAIVLRSAFLITGTTSPLSSATAKPDVRGREPEQRVAGEVDVHGRVAHERDRAGLGEDVREGRLRVALAQALDHRLARRPRPRSCPRSWQSGSVGACHASVMRRAIVLRSWVSGISSGAAEEHRGRGRACRSGLGALDVLGDDPAFGARAAERRQVDALLLREPARERRRLDPPAVAALDAGNRVRALLRLASAAASAPRSRSSSRAARGSPSSAWRRFSATGAVPPPPFSPLRLRRRSSPCSPITAIALPTSDLALGDEDLEERAARASASTSCVTFSVSSS